MIVDTSALAAILFEEEEGPHFADAMANATTLSISAGSWIELTTVLSRRGRTDLLGPAQLMKNDLPIAVLPVSAAQAEIGRAAYLRFGKGSGHAAKLNFGDCFAYALAMESGEPLLFKGDDFEQTDVPKAR